MSTMNDIAAYALANETPWPKSIREVIEGETFDPPPWNIVKGPIIDRSGPAGQVMIGDRLISTWGSATQADMIFSAVKSYIGLLAGIALDQGLIADLNDRVSDSVTHSAFAGHNIDVTWLQLLQQTSEWHGTLWSMDDTVDRNRQLSPTEDQSRFDKVTPHGPPGSYWDYNDIRVNALCLALTLVFGRSLRDVLDEYLMQFVDRPPQSWDWNGYPPESTITIDGKAVPVMVGGGHWGGGLVTTIAHDVYLGRVVAGRGTVDGRRIISTHALDILLTPCPLMKVYGGLWWLNTDRALYPAASENAVFALGIGLNAIWIEPDLDLVAVVHSIDENAFPGFIERVMSQHGNA